MRTFRSISHYRTATTANSIQVSERFCVLAPSRTGRYKFTLSYLWFGVRNNKIASWTVKSPVTNHQPRTLFANTIISPRKWWHFCQANGRRTKLPYSLSCSISFRTNTFDLWSVVATIKDAFRGWIRESALIQSRITTIRIENRLWTRREEESQSGLAQKNPIFNTN